MTEITRITKTRQGRFALFCGQEFLFSIDAETMIQQDIHEGSSLSEGELSLLKGASDTRKAKDAALRFLSLRAYGEKELYGKLCLRYDDHSAAAAVASMKALELLDDETFAVEKAKGMAERGKNSFEIRQKLQALGIDETIVAKSILLAQPDDGAAAILLLQKKYMEKLQNGERQKVMAALARRGFSHSVIQQAVRQTEQQLEKGDGR